MFGLVLDNYHMPLKILILQLPVFLWVCLWTQSKICIFVCVYVSSHTVGASRSSSLVINHCWQLIKVQSACERTACVFLWKQQCIDVRMYIWLSMCVCNSLLNQKWPLLTLIQNGGWITGGICAAATTSAIVRRALKCTHLKARYVRLAEIYQHKME